MSMSLLLNAVNYKKHCWQLCGDLKVIGLLLGLQMVYTKYCCFLCLWDHQATKRHYTVKDWPAREDFVPRKHNVKNTVLLNP
jgi:hypothetical protein